MGLLPLELTIGMTNARALCCIVFDVKDGCGIRIRETLGGKEFVNFGIGSFDGWRGCL